MDHSWRPRPPPPPPPPIAGNNSNICPVCSIPHFPFCPPPFNGNPKFHSQPQNNYYHQRAPFDHHPFPPIYHHHEPPAPNTMDYNYNYNTTDRRPPWPGSNLSPGTNPYGVGDYPMPANGDYNNYHRSGVPPDSHGYDHVGVKRMRIESIDSSRSSSGMFMAGESNDASRFSSENERILKLIRDHGNAGRGGLSQGGTSIFSESNGYVHERSGESCETRDDMGSKRRCEMSEFQNLGVESFERTESGLSAGPGLDLHDSNREDPGAMPGKNSAHYYQYGQVENSLPQSLDQSRYSSHPGGHFTTMGRSEQTHDELVHHYRGAVPYHSNSQRRELKQQPLLQRDLHYPATENLHQNDNSLQRLTPSETAMINDSRHSYPSQNLLPSPPFMIQHHLRPKSDILSPNLPTDIKKSVGVNTLAHDSIPSSVGHHNSGPPYRWLESKEGHYPPCSFGMNLGPAQVSPAYKVQPPLPASPPPPLPMALPRNHLIEPLASPIAKKPYLFPIAVSSSADLSSSRVAVPENQSSAQAYYADKANHHASAVSSAEEFHAWQSSSEKHVREVQTFPLRHLSSQKQNTIDAAHIFKPPYRTTRPDHLVIILRGLPGSGKSYLAKMLRDLEVENGGKAPRIHSMDEYFMTEVEKAEESDASKSSGSFKAKRPVMKTVMEYCYEPEMEEAYRASMLKAFKKTLDEGVYSFIIVDDRNLRVADFAQFWATAKRSGYEVYLLEAGYKDPAGCAARNVHNFTQDDIQKMAGQWEEAPSLYLKLDIKSLLHGDGFEESGIQEVDMDMEDDEPIDTSQGSDHKNPQNTIKDPLDDIMPHGPLKDAKHLPGSQPTEEVKHLSRSKWSDDLDDSEFHEAEGRKSNISALSGLVQAYSKEGKSVRWGDQGGDAGFSLSATRKTNARSLVIGPGSGYNLKSNPLAEEENLKPEQNAVEPKRQNVFQERMRAEHESFKAVFDKRRQRIGGFNGDEE